MVDTEICEACRMPSRVARLRRELALATLRNDDLETQVVALQNRIAELETEVQGVAGVAIAAMKARVLGRGYAGQTKIEDVSL